MRDSEWDLEVVGVDIVVSCWSGVLSGIFNFGSDDDVGSTVAFVLF